VAGSSETTILTYTVPALTTVYIAGANMSGSAAYKFRIKLNGTTFWTGRSTVATGQSQAAFGDGSPVATAAQVVTITAHHDEVAAQTCEVALYGYTTT